MDEGYKTPEEQSPVKNCPTAPQSKSSYIVFDSNADKSHKPMCLGAFMGAMEAYHRGMKLSDEDKECLTNAGYKI